MVRLHNRLKQRLPLWAVWLVYLGAAAALLWLLLVGLGRRHCYQDWSYD
jgi:hypothetical protein